MTFLHAGHNQMAFEDHYESVQSEEMGSLCVFVAESPVMRSIHGKIRSFASSISPVLILGAGGSGRTTVAREIFNADKAGHFKYFIKFACYGLNEKAIEKKLFGEGGEQGLLNCGSDTVLFIKGLDYWTPLLQQKALVHIMEHENKFRLPRLVCSAGEKFSQRVKEGGFSQDLFEIISQNLLILPRLSERTEDIPFLISLFNSQNSFQGGINQKAMKILESRYWEGNINELKNICLQISILHSGKDLISEEDISQLINKKAQIAEKVVKYNPNLSLDELINCYIQLSLNHFQSKRKSAKALGISVKTIYNKIKDGQVLFSNPNSD